MLNVQFNGCTLHRKDDANQHKVRSTAQAVDI